MASIRYQPQQQPGGITGPATNTTNTATISAASKAAVASTASASASASAASAVTPNNIATAPTPAASTTTPPSTTGELPPRSRSRKSRRHSLPFVFPPVFEPNASSTSIVPNTAEGRPIPLDDSTTTHRTTALRELNRSQPVSRHRYSTTSGTPNTTSSTTGTYSQPVLVRTYSGAPKSSTSRPASRRVPLSTVSVTSNASNSNWRLSRNGTARNMGRQKGKKQPVVAADAKLPPLEAFSFKNIMAEMQQDIGADLDRIAEICARSRYSLSNQYEVHVTPHGSGAGFLRSVAGSRHVNPGGPTLQAITSDDEHASSTRSKKRRSGGARRRSAAYGTLETIMSSSRSSDEEKGKKKKSAAEIAEEVRGRAARSSGSNGNGNGSGNAGSPGANSSTEAQASSEHQPTHSQPQSHTEQQQQPQRKTTIRRKSPSFANAVLDSSRGQQSQQVLTSHPSRSGIEGGGQSSGTSTALVSGPAKPKTSRSHLEIRTSSPPLEGHEQSVGGTGTGSGNGNYAPEALPQPSQAVISDSVASAAIANPEEPFRKPPGGLFSGLAGYWVPTWMGGGAITEVASGSRPGSDRRQKTSGGKNKSYAEGTLRDLLLKGADQAAGTNDHSQKGKTVESVERLT